MYLGARAAGDDCLGVLFHRGRSILRVFRRPTLRLVCRERPSLDLQGRSTTGVVPCPDDLHRQDIARPTSSTSGPSALSEYLRRASNRPLLESLLTNEYLSAR